MTTPAEPKPEGLRARKRRATENAIETSAVSLALELGMENVTVEAICERADISRSTFFNYFPARDYAIVGRAINLPEGSEAFSILDSSPEDLPLGIFRLLFAAIGHSYVNTEVARLRARLIAEQPVAGRVTMSSLLESGYALTLTAAAWLEANPKYAKLDSPVREASLAVSLMHGIITTQMTEWITGEGDITASEDDFHRSIDEYRALLN